MVFTAQRSQPALHNVRQASLGRNGFVHREPLLPLP